jgi:hypothetical protein
MKAVRVIATRGFVKVECRCSNTRSICVRHYHVGHQNIVIARAARGTDLLVLTAAGEFSGDLRERGRVREGARRLGRRLGRTSLMRTMLMREYSTR